MKDVIDETVATTQNGDEPSNQSTGHQQLPSVNHSSAETALVNHTATEVTHLDFPIATEVQQREATVVVDSVVEPSRVEIIGIPSSETTDIMHPADMADVNNTQRTTVETALEKAEVVVYFDSALQNRAYFRLRRCKTHKELFEQLYRRQPEDFAHKRIKAVRIRSMNADSAGVTDVPDRTIMEDDEEEFGDFIANFANYAPDVCLKLHVTVLYWN